MLIPTLKTYAAIDIDTCVRYSSVFRSPLFNELFPFFSHQSYLLVNFFAKLNIFHCFLSGFEPEKTGGGTRRERGKTVWGRGRGRRRKWFQCLQWCSWWRWRGDDDDDDRDEDGDDVGGNVVRGILCTYVPFVLVKAHFTWIYVNVSLVLVSLKLKKMLFLWLGRLFPLKWTFTTVKPTGESGKQSTYNIENDLLRS